MPLAPITEDDRPIIEKMILKLKSLRKREHAHDRKMSAENITNAIKELHEYGAMKGWWEINFEL